MVRYRRRRRSGGCLPGVALAFGLGVFMAITCSNGLVVLLLSLLLVGVVLCSCCC